MTILKTKKMATNISKEVDYKNQIAIEKSPQNLSARNNGKNSKMKENKPLTSSLRW